MHFQEADLLPFRGESVHCFLGGFRARSHDDNDTLGIGRTIVLEDLVLSSDDLGKAVHGLLDDCGEGVVKRVHRLAGLEEDVGVLGGAAHHGMFGRQRASAVRVDQFIVDHGAHVVLGQLLDLHHFVRCPEPVEEVEDRNAPFQRGRLCDQGEVHHFLHGIRGEEGEPGGAGCHHVAVVAEDRKGMSGNGAGGNVKDRRGELAGDLEHVRDHQQEALRRRECRGERAGLQRTVDGPGGASLALHLGDGGDSPPEILSSLGRPFVGPLPHVGRRRDRVDRDDFVHFVCNVGGGFVTVDSDHWAFHERSCAVVREK